jgi:hypothetical protein
MKQRFIYPAVVEKSSLIDASDECLHFKVRVDNGGKVFFNSLMVVPVIIPL